MSDDWVKAETARQINNLIGKADENGGHRLLAASCLRVGYQRGLREAVRRVARGPEQPCYHETRSDWQDDMVAELSALAGEEPQP